MTNKTFYKRNANTYMLFGEIVSGVVSQSMEKKTQSSNSCNSIGNEPIFVLATPKIIILHRFNKTDEIMVLNGL